MSNKDTGGSAFPLIQYIGGKKVLGSEGMTLRDYFAAKAMQSLLAKDTWEQSGPDMFARDAYAMADAMLEARKS